MTTINEDENYTYKRLNDSIRCIKALCFKKSAVQLKHSVTIAMLSNDVKGLCSAMYVRLLLIIFRHNKSWNTLRRHMSLTNALYI